MTRFIYTALCTLIGFFMTLTDIYACESKSENIENSCTKQSDTQKEKKNCCETEKGQCGKQGKDCEGKCGSQDCQCPTNYIDFTITSFEGFFQKKALIIKQNFYYQDTYCSLGFLSIWLPPKIV